MNTKFLLLTTLGVGAVGSSAGLGYWNFSKPKNLRDLLLSEKIKLLDVDSNKDDTNWTTLATKHKADTTDSITLTGNQKIPKITGLTINDLANNGGVNFSLLKEKCKTLLNSSLSIQNLKTIKNNVINWCSENSPILKSTSTSAPLASPGTSDSALPQPPQ